MKRGLEQKLTRRLLQFRESGPTYARFFRNNMRSYLVLLGLSGAGLGALVWLDNPAGFCVLFGLVLGALARDAGWVRNIRRTWPLSVAVTDWEKVQRIADGESVS